MLSIVYLISLVGWAVFTYNAFHSDLTFTLACLTGWVPISIVAFRIADHLKQKEEAALKEAKERLKAAQDKLQAAKQEAAQAQIIRVITATASCNLYISHFRGPYFGENALLKLSEDDRRKFKANCEYIASTFKDTIEANQETFQELITISSGDVHRAKAALIAMGTNGHFSLENKLRNLCMAHMKQHMTVAYISASGEGRSLAALDSYVNISMALFSCSGVTSILRTNYLDTGVSRPQSIEKMTNLAIAHIYETLTVEGATFKALSPHLAVSDLADPVAAALDELIACGKELILTSAYLGSDGLEQTRQELDALLIKYTLGFSKVQVNGSDAGDNTSSAQQSE